MISTVIKLMSSICHELPVHLISKRQKEVEQKFRNLLPLYFHTHKKKLKHFFLSQQNLYVMLLNMLAERGVDNDFCQWLLDYSTALEQQHYVKFLEDLHGFVKLQ